METITTQYYYRLFLILKTILLSVAIKSAFILSISSKIILSIFSIKKEYFFHESCVITKVCTSFSAVCLKEVGPPTVYQVSKTFRNAGRVNSPFISNTRSTTSFLAVSSAILDN